MVLVSVKTFIFQVLLISPSKANRLKSTLKIISMEVEKSNSSRNKSLIVSKLLSLDIALDTKTLIPVTSTNGTKLIGDSLRKLNKEEFFSLVEAYIADIMLTDYKVHYVEYLFDPKQDKIYIYSSFLNCLTQKILFVLPDINSYPTILSKGALVYEGIHVGSVLNIVKVAKAKGYTVHIMNSLLMRDDYYNHCLDAYERFVEKKLEVVKDIVLLGFGYGGIPALGIYRRFFDKGE